MSNQELLSAVNELPDGARVVFNLFVIDGFSHQEISEKLNISEGTSKSQLFFAKKILRKKLEEMGVSF
ncbi:MAG: RNA polymerase sigma factor [Emticicia sp.]|nr:RNA polymerase sigma factor [Emticicia sp.]